MPIFQMLNNDLSNFVLEDGNITELSQSLNQKNISQRKHKFEYMRQQEEYEGYTDNILLDSDYLIQGHPNDDEHNNIQTGETNQQSNIYTQVAIDGQRTIQEEGQDENYTSQTSVTQSDKQLNLKTSSVFVSRYLSSNSPRLDYLSELKTQIDQLRKDLKQKEDAIAQKDSEKASLREEYEKKIEQTRRETREKVQKVMEKRQKAAKQAEETIKSPPRSASLSEQLRAGRKSKNSSLTTRQLDRKNDEETNMPLADRRSAISAKRTRNQAQDTPSFNSLGLKSNKAKPMPESVTVIPPPELTFNNMDQLLETEARIRGELSKEYEDKLAMRITEIKRELTKNLREQIESEVRTDYANQIKSQKDTLRKEILASIQQDIDKRVNAGIQLKLSENLLQWEEDYKIQHIKQLSETIRQELDVQYEQRLFDMVEEEKQKLAEECRNEILDNIQATKDEAELVLHSKIGELNDQFERQMQIEREHIRQECIEELRNEREQQLQNKLRDKLTKRIEQELYATLPKMLEDRMRGQIEEKIAQELQDSNIKQINQLKRKLELQVDERSQELQQKFQRDFENEVRKRSEDLASKKEREIILKYKTQFDKDRRSTIAKLQQEFELTMKQMKEDLDRERGEVARLKSLEQVRLRKLGEQKKDMVERLRQEEIQIQRKKHRLDQEVKQQRVKEWEKIEQLKESQQRDRSGPVKVLQNDFGCEQVSRSYHIANMMTHLKSGSKSPSRAQVTEQQPVSEYPIQMKSQEYVMPHVSTAHISKESTFHPSGGLSPGNNLIDQIKLASHDYQPETLMSRIDEGCYNYRQDLSSDEKSTMTPRIPSPAPNTEARRGIYVKPSDSREAVKQLLKDSIDKFHIKVGSRANNDFSPSAEKENSINQQTSEKQLPLSSQRLNNHSLNITAVEVSINDARGGSTTYKGSPLARPYVP